MGAVLTMAALDALESGVVVFWAWTAKPNHIVKAMIRIRFFRIIDTPKDFT
jgi:hypothetical protein